MNKRKKIIKPIDNTMFNVGIQNIKNSMILGIGCMCGHSDVILLGKDVESEENNEIVIGSKKNTLRFKQDGTITHNGVKKDIDSSVVEAMTEAFREVIKEIFNAQEKTMFSTHSKYIEDVEDGQHMEIGFDFLHTHPKLEKELRVPIDHVIVDKKDCGRVIRFFEKNIEYAKLL